MGGVFNSLIASALTSVNCSGNESTLLDCEAVFSQQCGSNEDAAVVCQGTLLSLE